MKKFKTQKGITLVALIITIVVLLILAVVAIGAVRNSDIIGYAQNAAEGYETEKGKENEAIKDAEDLLSKYAPGDKKEDIGELKLNTKYSCSGKQEEISYIEFYSNGYCNFEYYGDLYEKLSYVIEGDNIKIKAIEFESDEYLENIEESEKEILENTYLKFKIIKGINNDIIVVEDWGGIGYFTNNELYATTSDGLKYFNGEKYVNENQYVILNSEGSEHRDTSGGGTSDRAPVFYNGKIYNFSFDDVNIITSVDNCETIIIDGETFIKSVE